jgi:hypothetical protein
MKSLVGKTVAIRPKEIAGPRILACKSPHYRVKDFPADWLFQGAFGEMHGRDKSADPVKIAASLGFRGSSWKTLETGCGNELLAASGSDAVQVVGGVTNLGQMIRTSHQLALGGGFGL